MKETEKERINFRYNERFAKYGVDIKTLASGSEERREIRFKTLTEVGLTQNCSILDVGCGFGDLYKYLKEIKLPVNYTGYDINRKFIDTAQKQYPGCTFKLCDIENEDFPQFDFIVSTSAFNLAFLERDNYEFIQIILRRMFEHSNRGVAIDFLSSYVDFKGEEAFHYDPEVVFKIAKSITKRVVLRHDYPLYEFCLYLYPDFDGWRKS